MNSILQENRQNIDYQEIAKFEKIAAHWWDTEGEFKLLHRINPLRLGYIAQHSEGLYGKKILDVGCGGGILAESMAREGALVTGIDMGLELLTVARLHALNKCVELNYILQTVETHTETYSTHYDVVTCMEMLEHVPDPCSVVHACARLVKPGGNVFFSTINRNLKAWLTAIIGAEYILHMIPCGTHDVKKFIRPSELLAWVDETPLHERNMVGIHYNPLTDRFRLGRSVHVHYMIHMHYYST